MRLDPIIYGLVDPRTGELRYIGKASYGIVRCASHNSPSSLKLRSKKNSWIKSLLKIGLKPIPFVVENHESPHVLDAAERHFIAYFRAIGCRLTNMTNGGDGRIGIPCSPETREKISAAQRGVPRPPNPEARRITGLKLRGRKRSSEAIRKTAEGNRGRKMKPEQVEDMRVAKFAEWAKPGHREKMILAHGGRTFVDQHGVEYFGINATARLLDLQAPHIHAVLNGTRKHTGGFVFRYKE